MAQVVVGIDIGSSSCEFAYARMGDPEQIHVIDGAIWEHNWWVPLLAKFMQQQQVPATCVKQAAAKLKQLVVVLPHCMYRSRLPTTSRCWGRIARLWNPNKPDKTSQQVHYIDELERDEEQSRLSYMLESMSCFVMEELRSRYAGEILRTEVQWCLTVPAAWSESAKRKMREIAQRAGMVTGRACLKHKASSASRYPLLIFRAPEAASAYFSPIALLNSDRWRGQNFMVVDASVDMEEVVIDQYRLTNDLEMVGKSSRCRWTLDARFFSYIQNKAGCTLSKVMCSAMSVAQQWEGMKCGYDGTPGWSFLLKFPPSRVSNIAELMFTSADMKAILDPVIWQLLQFIDSSTPSQDPGRHAAALIVTGGIATYPYLMKKIRAQFDRRINVINSSNSVRANCHGAVILGTCRAATKSKATTVSKPSTTFQHASAAPECLAYQGKIDDLHIFARGGECVYFHANKHLSTSKCPFSYADSQYMIQPARFLLPIVPTDYL